ncbi:sigma-70 family RNA polymerase sigma factor [Nocardia sp. BSTN01]|uniref:sigma-70 family RNA polymerase sigma factor n=1 Tax=Nocardia sp. BSTN01 TaxID=2783665 RepID=UPI00188E23B0|nr:sigma-70 family RNA polymerase sigma factor [Nocardia sp. BSTN01]MBF5000390.1 sigma-70 family RNA polymerase sigma factor [Nocardia sp. BSTN01]
MTALDSSAAKLDPDSLFEYRGELIGYCYRMLGSPFDAEDAVQETLERAWRSRGQFRGESSARGWLYRIATNICFDQLRGRGRRALPMGIGGPTNSDGRLGEPLSESAWLQPVPDAWLTAETNDPADHVARAETVRLAFVSALQHLSPRERSVLILRDVLAFRATEVADLLDTTVPSVNGYLRRARAALIAAKQPDGGTFPNVGESDRQTQELLERYVKAFQLQDLASLMTILHEEARLSMPPYTLWIQGVHHVLSWFDRHSSTCANSRLVPLRANGSPAYAHYHRNNNGAFTAFAIQVLDITDGRISAIEQFLAPELFELFELPATLTE